MASLMAALGFYQCVCCGFYSSYCSDIALCEGCDEDGYGFLTPRERREKIYFDGHIRQIFW
jgi:hypothetical protein